MPKKRKVVPSESTVLAAYEAVIDAMMPKFSELLMNRIARHGQATIDHIDAMESQPIFGYDSIAASCLCRPCVHGEKDGRPWTIEYYACHCV